jgi:hypothetical protein
MIVFSRFMSFAEAGAGILVTVLSIFFAIVIVIVMAPVLGQLGGGWYELLFVLLAIAVIVAGIAGLARR